MINHTTDEVDIMKRHYVDDDMKDIFSVEPKSFMEYRIYTKNLIFRANKFAKHRKYI